MFHKTFTAFAAIAFIGCATTTTTHSIHDEIHATSNPHRIRVCKFVSEVRVAMNLAPRAAVAHDRALIQLKERTKERGGNIVLIGNVFNDKGNVRMLGEAYKCN